MIFRSAGIDGTISAARLRKIAARLGAIAKTVCTVAKIEAAAPSVLLDLIVRALTATGATQQEIKKAFTSRGVLAA